MLDLIAIIIITIMNCCIKFFTHNSKFLMNKYVTIGKIKTNSILQKVYQNFLLHPYSLRGWTC